MVIKPLGLWIFLKFRQPKLTKTEGLLFHSGIQGDWFCHLHLVIFEVILSISIHFVKEHEGLGVRDCCRPGLEGACLTLLTFQELECNKMQSFGPT